jgi:hypothetical protein
MELSPTWLRRCLLVFILRSDRGRHAWLYKGFVWKPFLYINWMLYA